MIYITSDWHLNHFNIIRYTNRPFKTTEEMDRVIIDNTNKMVGSNDTLIFAGDLMFPRGDGGKTIAYYMDQIKCKNISFIYGNHDRQLRRQSAEMKKYFQNVGNDRSLMYNGIHFYINHYKDTIFSAQYPNSIMLHGHNHGAFDYGCKNMFDIGVDGNGFMPHSLDDIVKYSELRKDDK